MAEDKFMLTLRQCRYNLGLSQRQVANALCLERSTYAYYETGVTKPNCSLVIRLSKLFNVDYRIFMEAIADGDIDENFTTLDGRSWEEREKFSKISKDEQELLLDYRLFNREQKDKLKKAVNKIKKG